MDLHAIIGQRLVFGFQGPALTESFRQLVRQYKIGNVILFRHNVVDNAQLRALCTDIQQLVQSETGHPAFITIDQDGCRRNGRSGERAHRSADHRAPAARPWR